MDSIQVASVNESGSPLSLHPYYPVEVELLHYVANDYTVIQLLSSFAAGCIAILGLTRYLSLSVRPTMSVAELSTIMWFVLSGSIHIFFEGYFALNYRNLAGLQTLFGQLWKEYALADSRYLTLDPFVLCMEAMTAVLWGPLCFLVAILIAKDNPLRHSLQIMVSMGQLYGDLLYYATSMFEHYVNHVNYSRPEAFYFWGYYFFMNFIWICVPAYLIFTSASVTYRCFKDLDAARSVSKKHNIEQHPKKES